MTTKVAGYIGKINPGDGKEHALGSTAYGYCETAAATAAKVVDMTGFKLVEGATIFVKFKERNNVANPTLNVNGTGAKPIYRYATTRPGTNDDTSGWRAGAILAFTYDGAGWMHHYWQNTQYNLANNSLGGGNFTANSAIYRYQLLFHMTREKLTPLNNNDNTTTTTKTILTSVDFDLFEKIYYYNSTTTVAANASVGASALYFTMSSIDLRYTFNCGDSSLTAHEDVYLKVSKQSSGLFRLASATPTTQTLPSSADGYYYCLLGRATSAYSMALYEDHPIYYYDGGLKVLLDHNHDERYYTESEVDTKLSAKANLASPALTGTPTAPTASSGTNTTQIATTAFVQSAVSSSANNKVSKSGDTMTGALIIEKAGAGFYVSKNNNIELGGTAPSADERTGGLHWRDKNDRNAGYIENLITPTGKSITRIIARNIVNNANADNVLDLAVNADGTIAVGVTNSAIWRSALGAAASSHTHDDRYFTESEINTKLGDYQLKLRNYSKFADIPNDAGLYYVTYASTSDADAPLTGTGTYHWNVLQIGIYGSRVLQLASMAFSYRDVLWFRVKHDSTWHGWYSIDGDNDKTFTSGTLLAKVNEYRAYRNFPVTFTKTGSASISDLPSGMSATSEFNVLLTGSKTRTSVYVNAFGGDGKTYRRDVFNSAWLIDWQQV